MSSNTNTLFWVITGAVVVLGVFLLVNNSQSDTLNSVGNKFSGLYHQANASPDLIKYYSHESNYATLKVSDESLFGFDESTGTITNYYGNEKNVVFPATINGVEVKKIADMNLWNNSLYYDECKTYITQDPNDEWVQHRLEMLEWEGVLVDGVCQERVLLDSVVIPNTVEEIGNCAFCYNRNLKKITLPNSIKKIGNQAFHENQIESVELSHLKDLTYIGTYAFAYNNISGEIVIPDSVTSMDYYAFGDNNITSAIVSKNLKKLPMFTFINNPNMEHVTFRNSNMEVREKVSGVDKTFGQDSDFIIYVPTGSKSWYSKYPALSDYRILEVNIDE